MTVDEQILELRPRAEIYKCTHGKHYIECSIAGCIDGEEWHGYEEKEWSPSKFKSDAKPLLDYLLGLDANNYFRIQNGCCYLSIRVKDMPTLFTGTDECDIICEAYLESFT